MNSLVKAVGRVPGKPKAMASLARTMAVELMVLMIVLNVRDAPGIGCRCQ